MGAVYFYHLTRSALEGTLPALLGKARAAGWRVVVRAASEARADWLDERLWLTPEDGFLPHARAGGEHDAEQPVLLTAASGLPRDVACLMAVDGAEVTAEEVAALERVCILFDGNDAGAVEMARAQWRGLTGAGCSAQYWSQESGTWQKRAER